MPVPDITLSGSGEQVEDYSATVAEVMPPSFLATTPSEDEESDVDAQILEALKSQKDRLYVLKLGETMEALILERNIRTRVEMQPASTYQRLLVHRCAAYYKLMPEHDSQTKAIIVTVVADSRIPARRLAELVPPETSPLPAFKIMRRSTQTRSKSNSYDDNGSDDCAGGEGSEHGSIKSPSHGNGRKKRMTIAEREAAYNEARSRIFMDFEEKEKENLTQTSASSSTLSLASGTNGGGGSSFSAMSSCGDTDAASTAPTESEYGGPIASKSTKDRRMDGPGPLRSTMLRSNAPPFMGPANGNTGSFSYPTLYEPPPSNSYGDSGLPSNSHIQNQPQNHPPPPPPPPPPPGGYPMYPVYPYPPGTYLPHYPYYPYPYPQPAPGSSTSPSDPYPPQYAYGPPHQYWAPPPQPQPQPLPPPPPPNPRHNNQAPPHMHGPPPQPLHMQGYQQPPAPVYGYPPPVPYYPNPHPPPPPPMEQYRNGNSGPVNGHMSNVNVMNHHMHPGLNQNSRSHSRGSIRDGMSHSFTPESTKRITTGRAPWSYGPGVGIGGMPVNGHAPEGMGIRVMPPITLPLPQERRRPPSNSGGGSGGARTPADETASTASSSTGSSSSSRRTFTSTSSKHPLPPRPDWAINLKPQPSSHNAMTPRRANPVQTSVPTSQQPQQPLPQPQPPGEFQLNDFPPLVRPADFPPLTRSQAEKRAPTVGGAWTNSSTRSILAGVPPAHLTNNAPAAGPNQNVANGQSQDNGLYTCTQISVAGAIYHTNRLDEHDRGFERPPPKGGAELFNPQAPGRGPKKGGSLDGANGRTSPPNSEKVLVEKVGAVKLEETGVEQ